MRSLKIFIILCILVILFTACSGKRSELPENTVSFRKSVGEEMDVIYLGKPRFIGDERAQEYEWTSSDNNIATVKNGIVTGLSEGIVKISQLQDTGIINEWQFAVTTFNDGKQAELSYSLGPEKISELLSGKYGVLTPDYWKQNINTIRDVITYLQVGGFTRSSDIPLLASENSYWYRCAPGDTIMYENRGWSEDIASVAGYLLADDFEDWGYIISFGYSWRFMNWFYEDGHYYIFNFADLFKDFEEGIRDASYDIFVTDNIEDISGYITERIELSKTLTVIMFSALGHDFQPAYRLSYLHDSSEIYHKHNTISMEETVFTRSEILYSNPEFDYEVIPVPVSEMPAGMPVYGINYDYVYE